MRIYIIFMAFYCIYSYSENTQISLQIITDYNISKEILEFVLQWKIRHYHSVYGKFENDCPNDLYRFSYFYSWDFFLLKFYFLAQDFSS